MSYTKKVAYSTVAQMVGKLAGTAISFVTVAILFRYFGIDGIGKYTTVFAFVGFFAVLADFGLQWTLIRELAVNEDKDKVFRNIFSFRFLSALVLYGAAFGAVWFFNYPHDVKVGVGIIALATFFTTMNSALVSVYLNNFRLDITVAAEVVGRAITLGLIYIVVSAGGSFMAAMATYVGGNIINLAIDFYFLDRFIKFGMSFDFKYWRHVVKQAIPIGIVMVFGFIYYKIDSVMLSLLKGMTDIGIYGTAYKMLEILQTIPVMFLGAAFPLVTRYATTGDERVRPAFQKSFDFLILLAVPVVVIFFFLAEPIIHFVAGTKGNEFVSESTVSAFGYAITSVVTMKILIFSVGINFISQLYIYMVLSLGRQKAAIWPTFGFALFNVILNLILIPHYSYLGAAIATILTEIIVCITYILLTNRFMRLPIAFHSALKLVFAGLLMAVLTYSLNSIGVNMFVNVLASFILYGALIYLFGAIPTEIINQLKVKGEK